MIRYHESELVRMVSFGWLSPSVHAQTFRILLSLLGSSWVREELCCALCGVPGHMLAAVLWALAALLLPRACCWWPLLKSEAGMTALCSLSLTWDQGSSLVTWPLKVGCNLASESLCSCLGISAKLDSQHHLQPSSCQQGPLNSLCHLNAKGSSRGPAQTLPKRMEAQHVLQASFSHLHKQE